MYDLLMSFFRNIYRLFKTPYTPLPITHPENTRLPTNVYRQELRKRIIEHDIYPEMK